MINLKNIKGISLIEVLGTLVVTALVFAIADLLMSKLIRAFENHLR